MGRTAEALQEINLMPKLAALVKKFHQLFKKFIIQVTGRKKHKQRR